MKNRNFLKNALMLSITLLVLLAACEPITPLPPTVTASVEPTPTLTATSQPTKTAIPTVTSTPQPELATPRWMLLNQPYYSVEILGEQWDYYTDNWGEMHACIRYQQNDYERYFEQCFGIIDEDTPTLTYDGILDGMLENGLIELNPRTTFPNADRISLSGKRSKDDQVVFFEIVESKPYILLVEMYVTERELEPLQDIYEAYAAEVMDHAILSAMQKSKIVPAPSPTPMSPEQQSNYDDHSDLLISKAEAEALYPGRLEDLGDYVSKYRICREFEDRTNADVLWVSMTNCVQVTTPNVTMEEIKEFYTQEDDVFPDSKYAAENYLVFGYGQGHLYYTAVTYGDGLAFVSVIETRSLVGTTLENGFTENIDDFLHAVLMENLKKYE